MNRSPRFALVALWMFAVTTTSFASQQAGDDAPKPKKAAGRVKLTTDLSALIQAHNAERKAHDLGPLKPSPKLTEAAAEHARDMATSGVMSHEGTDESTPEGRVRAAGYVYQRTGENVAAGQKSSGEVMGDWMASEHHRENILGDFTEIGAAKAISPDGIPFWCVEFGSTWPQLDPTKAATGVVDRINAAREDRDLDPLTAKPVLMKAAGEQAAFLADRGALQHERTPDEPTALDRVEEAGYRYARLGEAGASGIATPEGVVDSWLESGAYRDNLFNPDFRHVGVGYAIDAKGIPYWCLVLARPAPGR